MDYRAQHPDATCQEFTRGPMGKRVASERGHLPLDADVVTILASRCGVILMSARRRDPQLSRTMRRRPPRFPQRASERLFKLHFSSRESRSVYIGDVVGQSGLPGRGPPQSRSQGLTSHLRKQVALHGSSPPSRRLPPGRHEHGSIAPAMADRRLPWRAAPLLCGLFAEQPTHCQQTHSQLVNHRADCRDAGDIFPGE